ncbi:hypothetical protein SBA4_360017 [Candidatus Sulfopaludibacter sp. SbA4]|nr:hypothetical protein SBA4_360017 [Candidatus Sulfopaludibacter sp. SbA4]
MRPPRHSQRPNPAWTCQVELSTPVGRGRDPQPASFSGGDVRSDMRLLLALLAVSSLSAQQYDLVLANGHVMDPASGTDAVRHIGIRGGRRRCRPARCGARPSWTSRGWWWPRDSSTCIRTGRPLRTTDSKRATA